MTFVLQEKLGLNIHQTPAQKFDTFVGRRAPSLLVNKEGQLEHNHFFSADAALRFGQARRAAQLSSYLNHPTPLNSTEQRLVVGCGAELAQTRLYHHRDAELRAEIGASYRSDIQLF